MPLRDSPAYGPSRIYALSTTRVEAYVDEWLVRLKGHQFDLEELAGHFTSATRNVGKDEDGYYYLRSESLNQMTDSQDVHERALKLIESINGAASYHVGSSYRPVEFDGLTQIDETGQRHNFVFLSGVIEARSHFFGNLTVSRAGEAINVPPARSQAETLADLADQNEKVADALRFYQRGDWINLYKAWEVVCDAAGDMRQVIKNGWAAEPDRGRFTGTAQSRAELGDEARHAAEKYKAPENPMTLNEAQDFVRSVIRAWVATL